MVIEESKQLGYKVWLDELNTTPSNAYFATFTQFYDLIRKQNPEKIESLKEIVAEFQAKFATASELAMSDLQGLLDLVKKSALKDSVISMPEIEKYEQVRDGKITVMGENLPDTLYHAIRLTIEEFRRHDKFKDLDHLISVESDFRYLDYAKVTEAYPGYKKYKDLNAEYDKREKEEAWGAMVYLNWAKGFFKNVLPEQAGSFVKSDITSNLRRLILYVLTPEVSETKNQLAGMNKINLLKVYDVLLDIEEKYQLVQEPKLIIQLHPQVIRFRTLFPIDSPNMSDRYMDFRLDALKYLKNEGVLKEFEFVAKGQGIDTRIRLEVRPTKLAQMIAQADIAYKDRIQRTEKTEKPSDEKEETKQLNPAQTGDKVVYSITYTKSREILLNDTLQLGRPDFDSENDVVFDYLYKHPKATHTKEEIEAETHRDIGKPLHKIVENLGFTKNFKKAFFNVSKTSICFNNPVTESDMQDLGLKRINL